MIKKFIKLTDFLKFEQSPFILGAFLSRIMEVTDGDDVYFFAYTNFKRSKYVTKYDFNLKKYSNILQNKLNEHSKQDNWVIHSCNDTSLELRFYIKNDLLAFTKPMFYNAIYQKTINSNWSMTENMDENQKDFIRGFMELRGSIDTTAKFITQDYFYDNRIELKKAQILTQNMNLPLAYMNFNARNLQPQFVSGENRRNTQFRINAFYYASKIGFINEYKALIFQKAYNQESYIADDIVYFNSIIPAANDSVQFVNYLNFFTNNIYQRKLTVDAIKHLREELKFDASLSGDKKVRNKAIIKLFDAISEDKCSCCGTTTTYTKQNGRQYFEIHHVIPFYKGVEVDNIANLVKLCPTCHRLLKKGSSTKDNQIKAINKILVNNPIVLEFVTSFLGEDDFNKLVEKIWSLLG